MAASFRSYLADLTKSDELIEIAKPTDPRDIAALAWPGFELFIHRLRNHPQLYPMLPDSMRDSVTDQSSELRGRIQRMKTIHEIFDLAHENVTREQDPLIGHLALRHLENLIEAILEGHDLAKSRLRLVFFIDEFDYLLAAMPNYFFVALRGIRDRFKYRVTYVTFTRNMLPDLVSAQRMKVLEPFIELFNDKLVWLGPYSDPDAWQMIDRIEKRTVRREDKALGLCIVVTGKFAGLLRASIEHTEDLKSIARDDYWGAAQVLYEKENVAMECEILLRNLTDDEINALYTVACNQGEPNPKIARELEHKSLLAWNGSRYTVQPYLLAVFIANNSQPPKGREPVRPSTLPEGHAMR